MFQFLISTYQSWKNAWSPLFAGKQSLVLPILANAAQVNDLVQELIYTGDPFTGVGDFTQSAEYLYWCVDQSRRDPRFQWPSVDCDDYAELARGLFRKMPNFVAQRMILLDVSLTKSHVVCWFRTPDMKYGTIDTNGLNYFTSTNQMKKFFEQLYGVKYILASGE